MAKKQKPLTDEKWEVVTGGNFVEVWHAGRCTSENDYAGFEEGAICRMTLPRAHTNTISKAIAEVRPRARAMAHAPKLLHAIELALIYLEDGAPNTAAERLREAYNDALNLNPLNTPGRK